MVSKKQEKKEVQEEEQGEEKEEEEENCWTLWVRGENQYTVIANNKEVLPNLKT